MSRLLVMVEGQTEETFVREVLRPHLFAHSYVAVDARLMGNARQRSARGGVRPWPPIKRDLLHHLAQDRGAVLAMMVDYYGMPRSDRGGWPGRAAASELPFIGRGAAVEEAITREIVEAMSPSFDARRFIPCVVMHEFEGLLFSDCEAFARSIGRPDLAPRFQAIRDRFQTPEEINDSPATAPAKQMGAALLERPGFLAIWRPEAFT